MHRLVDKNIQNRTAICEECGPVKIASKGKSSKGVQKWICNKRKLQKHKKRRINNRKNLLHDFCQKCGFIPEHICQLDIDHIDGDRENNNLDNLQTLCANCHRLKTFMNGDWAPRLDRLSL